MCFTNNLEEIALVNLFLIYELFDSLLIILYFRKIANDDPEFSEILTFRSACIIIEKVIA